MSVTKYRSVADMPPPERVTGDALVDRIRAVWERSRRLCPPAYTPGVQKFRSIEEAQAARARDERERVRAIRVLRRCEAGEETLR